MHEEIVNIIAFNAFNGMGDYTGNDDFGISVAWIDLEDYLEDYNNPERYSAEISREAIAYNGNHRYALVFWDANGNRSIDGYESFKEMMEVFTLFRNDYEEWSLDNDNDSTY